MSATICEDLEKISKSKEYQRKYYYNKIHKNPLVQSKQKEYYKNHREKLLEDHKQYQIERYREHPEKYRTYYQEKSSEILEKLAVKIQCECGRWVQKSHLVNHKKLKIHQKFLDSPFLLIKTGC